MAALRQPAEATATAEIEADRGLLNVRLAAAPLWRIWYLRNERIVMGIVGLVSVIALWELLVRAGILRAMFISSPIAIAQATVEAIQDGSLASSVASSLTEYVLGYGLAAFIGDSKCKDILATITRTFRARRDAAVEALGAIPGVSCQKPGGAFFVIAKLPITDTEAFARWLLTDYELDGETVHVTPMPGFYLHSGMGRDEVRVAYVLEEEALRHAIHLLGAGLLAYQAAHN